MTELIDDDTRTPAQHMADVAATTLARLARLHDELEHLGGQLSMLADWTAEHQPSLPHEWLGDVADTVDELGCCVPELVRDIAATLPTRHRHLLEADGRRVDGRWDGARGRGIIRGSSSTNSESQWSQPAPHHDRKADQ
jgi:hypothetical protein